MEGIKIRQTANRLIKGIESEYMTLGINSGKTFHVEDIRDIETIKHRFHLIPVYKGVFTMNINGEFITVTRIA
jgi:hypothetical protein